MTRKSTKQLKSKSTRDAFGEVLPELAEKIPELVVLTADLADSTRVTGFAEKYPKRFFQIGVAEQNMASLAVGMSLAGKIPVITSFGVFSPAKNWDQIRVGVCMNEANVKIVSTHCGINVGEDGATHQALEDIALMRVLPGMKVFSPVDFEETKEVVRAAFLEEGPAYVRLTRAKTPVLEEASAKGSKNFKVGSPYVLEEGTKVALVGTGPILTEGLFPAREINEKYPESIKVVNIPTIKPLDVKKFLGTLEGISHVVTLEEHQITGGLGSLVSEILSMEGLQKPRKIVRMGMQDTFGESGSYEDLKKKFGLDSESIKKVLLKELKEAGI
ncbi:transketolase family protein [candidate division WWE3 bacterium]|nr:transketolase family protein [candidate division WWE3 bacterium]